MPLTEIARFGTETLIEIKEFYPIERTSHSKYLLSLWNPFLEPFEEEKSFFGLYGNISIKIFMKGVVLRISIPLSEVILILFFYFYFLFQVVFIAFFFFFSFFFSNS